MGLYLTKPETTKLTQSGQVFDYTYTSTSLQGWQIQQDEFTIIKEKFDQENSLFCIVEQYGGIEYGKYIQDHIVEALINDQEYKQKNYDKAIVSLYERLDNQLKNQFKESTSYQGVTLLLTLITNENIYVANAGLSRCVIRYEGKHKVMTVEHYPINDLEKQRILAAGGEVWENRLNAHLPYSRGLGNFEYKSNSNLDQSKQLLISVPSIKYVDKEDTELILMGSHGFWETWTNNAITEMILERIQQGKALSDILETICDSIVAKNVESEYGKDNISSILIYFQRGQKNKLFDQ
ncbi:unnamed protein product [Paramecium primaurelia]|uniref:protein-serine/threonine phosphatase n=1 Tax=Paramecium primaurelia TaxID=5886 RepID=A0A8S1LAX9_PARPR|nr:unnamed protein product [Paramecium primaurelia]